MFHLRVAATILLLSNGVYAQDFSIASPKGDLKARLSLNGAPSYEVYHGEDQVIGSSSLGVVRADADFTGNLTLEGCEPVTTDTQEYDMLQGKKKHIKVDYSRSSCVLRNSNDSAIHVDLAVSDTSFAFRYHFPRDGYLASRYVLAENSTFNVTTLSPESSYQLLQSYDAPVPKYQTFYQPRGTRKPTPIGGGDSSTGFALPGLFKTQAESGRYFIHIKEAGFDGRFPSSHFSPEIVNGSTFKLDFPDPNDGNGKMGATYGYSPLPWTLPWRIITVSKTSAAAVIEDTSVTDLSAPSEVDDTSFVQPGVASWSWWSGSSNPTNYAATKHFINMASKSGWQYNILDARWDQQTEDGAPDSPLVTLATTQEYAASRNVSLLVWLNSAGENNDGSIIRKSPKDLLWQTDIRRDTMATLAEAGVKGMKVDGIESDKQAMQAYLLDIIRDAAAHKLILVCHNSPTPKGWERTWPNLLSWESAIASEEYANEDHDYGSQMPENNVNEAFVRYPIGPTDYGPGTFSRHLFPSNSMLTTDAHETALNVIVDTGLRILPDSPEMYESKPIITRILGETPFVWDETTFLAGEPGKYFVVARRSGDLLYVAAINGETEFISPFDEQSHPEWKPTIGRSRCLTIDLEPLLGENHNARPLVVLRDTRGDQNGTVVEDDENLFHDGTKIKIRMEPFGGFLAQIKI